VQDFSTEFLDHLSSLGMEVTGKVTGDDTWRRLKVNGEKNSNLRYQLKITPDYGIARFVYSRDGESRSWHSKNSKQMTAEEKAMHYARIKADKIACEARVEKEYMQAADKARRLWASYSPASNELDYIIRKEIEPLAARQTRDILVLPVYNDNKLWSLQFINKDGNKRFLSGGKIKGGFGSLVFKNDSKEKVVITEGYATAVSIRMATGLPVFFAYMADNLMSVAKTVRKNFPDSEIIIASDNDQFTMKLIHQRENKDYKEIPPDDPLWKEWRNGGMLVNAGVEKSTEAALKYDCLIAVPEFKDIDTKPTDYNDLHTQEGLEAVSESILSATAPHISESMGEGVGTDNRESGDNEHGSDLPAHLMDVPLSVYEDDYSEETQRVRELFVDHRDQTEKPPETEDDKNWQERLIQKSNGQLVPTSLSNVDLIIRFHRFYKDLFCYDEFSHEKTLIACPPWESPSTFKVRPYTDEDNTRLGLDLEERLGLKPSLSNLKKVLDSIIVGKPRHPAREYFGSLVWDGVPRLDTWLEFYCGATEDDPEYLAAVGRKWLVASVARIFKAGTKFDHMLIFEGTQNSGKSSMLRELATICGREYFDDTIKVSDMGNDKTVPKMQGMLIIEIAELSGFKKKDADELKQAITTQVDKIIRKYANEPTTYPRQFVLAGTINPNNGYLHDPTGNRRFWPVKTADKLDVQGIARDKEQLWAEAVHLFKQGEKLYLEDELYTKATEAQEDRRTQDPWLNCVEKFTKNLDMLTPDLLDNLWSELGLKMYQRDKYNNDRLGKIMTQVGFMWGRKRINNIRTTVWSRDDRSPELEYEEVDF